MKFAFFDESGRVQSAHNDTTAVTLPQGAVELTDEQWSRRFDLRRASGQLVFDVAPVPMEDAAQTKRSEIRAAFAAVATAKVTALGVTWQGGFESAIKLDAARRLAEAAGAVTVDFYDADDVAHTLGMADATAVAIAVGAAYQSAFAKKKAAFRAIAAATSQADLDAITWSTP